MATTALTDRTCSECWERALYCYATAQILLSRARTYRNSLQALSFIGIVVPLLVGGIVLTFGMSSPHFDKVILFAGILGLAQLVVSAASIVYGWADALEYSLDSSAENLFLSEEFKRLGQTAVDPPQDLDARAATLRARDESRRTQDARKGVSDKEFRFGHRAGLRQFGKACVGCQNIPTSMTATDCPVCGRF